MRRVGRLLLVHRPLARVLHGEGGGDDQHLVEAVLVARREDHARDPRVDRQPRELCPERRQLVVLVDRAQLVQRLEAVLDRPVVRRLDEREVLNLAQPQELHLEDHARQVGAQDFRLGELRPRVEILLGVEADADPFAHAPAAARALVRARA
jgi:hypothetical protein